jgi:hypothetical protein
LRLLPVDGLAEHVDLVDARDMPAPVGGEHGSAGQDMRAVVSLFANRQDAERPSVGRRPPRTNSISRGCDVARGRVPKGLRLALATEDIGQRGRLTVGR